MKTWMKNTAAAIAIVLAGLIVGEAQITVPHVFTTSVPVSQLNTDLSTLGAGALNRAGGTVTGNISVDSGVTIDGVDIGATLGGTGDPSFDTVTVTGTGASAIDVAGGINAGSGNVGIVDTTGKIPAISSPYFASLSGANLTGLLFSQLTTTWSNQSHSAGNFTTNGAGGWTVEPADIVVNRYVEFGKTVIWNIVVTNTTVTAATGTELRFTLPNSKTATAGGSLSGVAIGLNNGVAFTGLWQIVSGSTYASVYSDAAASTAWTAAANTTQIRLHMTYEVQ